MAPHRFELVGGHPALDFLNTVHDWTEEPRRDYLGAFGDAVRFGEAVGLLTRTEARRLAGSDNSVELARLVELRAVLQRVVGALLAGRTPRAAELDVLAASAADVAAATRLHGSRGRGGGREGGMLRRTLAMDAAGPAVLRLRIADAALTLLTSDAARRVKSCPACGWFFIDTTRNQSRRWCSMANCGASAKSKRYYQRTRGLRTNSR